MEIVTYVEVGSEKIKAMTREEYNANPQIIVDADEFIWQEMPSKAAAKRNHMAAMDIWYDANKGASA